MTVGFFANISVPKKSRNNDKRSFTIMQLLKASNAMHKFSIADAKIFVPDNGEKKSSKYIPFVH